MISTSGTTRVAVVAFVLLVGQMEVSAQTVCICDDPFCEPTREFSPWICTEDLDHPGPVGQHAFINNCTLQLYNDVNPFARVAPLAFSLCPVPASCANIPCASDKNYNVCVADISQSPPTKFVLDMCSVMQHNCNQPSPNYITATGCTF